MEKLIIDGGNRLEGTIEIQGSKNSSLPILAATLLVKGECVIHNCPKLTDTEFAICILKHLGSKVTQHGNTVVIDSSVLSKCTIPQSLMCEMRSSIVFLGSMLSRLGKAELCQPGGCEIGLRPIDLHISSLRQLGAQIKECHGKLICSCEKGFSGKNISLSFPSVGATENIILASVVSNGITTVSNPAREPEINDLVNFLNSCGGKIVFDKDGSIIIEGVKKLYGCEYEVMSDRIVASTVLSAVALTGGDVLMKKTAPDNMKSVISVFEQMGALIDTSQNSLRIKKDENKPLKCVKKIITMPYPGFPTDAQAPVMASMCLANGTGIIVENIFENRFRHVPYLKRFNADIKVEGRVAVINGRSKLFAAQVEATDLRGGSALVCAALAAEGRSEIANINYIDRGYEKIEEMFRNIGGNIRRDKLNG